MSELKVGFSKCDITPSIGCYLQGHNKERIAQYVGDPLHVRCAVFENEGTAVLLYFDLIGIRQAITEEIRSFVAESIGCDRKDVFVACTHTHYGPNINNGAYPFDHAYIANLKNIAAHAARMAKNDLHPSQMYYAQSTLEGITFVRRYRMKDGSVRTNPGRRNPDIVGPMNEADESIRLLRIVREGAGEILLVNFQCHPDVIGTNGEHFISADYPGVVCDTLEKALPGVCCMYCNGTAGDLNHVDVNCPEWDPNRGMDHARHMGRSIAGKILGMYTKARPIEGGPVRTAEKVVQLPIKQPTAEQLENSLRILEQAKQNGNESINTTVLYEARMYVRVSQTTEIPTARVTAFSMGDFCGVGIPGEPFCEIGKWIRRESPAKVQFVFGLTNGCEGYFPMKDAFEVNGYEARTSKFRPGVGEVMAETGTELAKQLCEAMQKN